MGPRVPAVAASTFDPDAADALLREHGCVVIEGVVPRAACAAASTLVDSLLAEALSRCGQTSTSDDVSGSSDDALAAAHRLFGNVLAPTRRRDLRVPLAEAIRACVYPALERLRPVLAATLTEDALVAELSALVCDPGAAAQPLHPDTQILGARSAAPLLTAFIALDDVLAPERGPTEIVLRSHDAAAHDALRAAAPSAAAAAAAAAGDGAALRYSASCRSHPLRPWASPRVAWHAATCEETYEITAGSAAAAPDAVAASSRKARSALAASSSRPAHCSRTPSIHRAHGRRRAASETGPSFRRLQIARPPSSCVAPSVHSASATTISTHSASRSSASAAGSCASPTSARPPAPRVHSAAPRAWSSASRIWPWRTTDAGRRARSAARSSLPRIRPSQSAQTRRLATKKERAARGGGGSTRVPSAAEWI